MTYKMVAFDSRIRLWPKSVHLAAITATHSKWIDYAIGHNVIVASTTCGAAPPPSYLMYKCNSAVVVKCWCCELSLANTSS